MRDIKPAIEQAWRSRDFIGERRASRRVTVQQGRVGLHDVGYNLYSSIVFGAPSAPKEMPNVKSISWQRAYDAEIASATVVFWNSLPVPVGTVLSEDLDRPGYFTYNRGGSTSHLRWGLTPNEWSGLLMPDNIIRTFEGYGFDGAVCPEDDEHLEQTGVWLIDEVRYGLDGLITVTARDLGRVLADQIVFPPVVPKAYYPLSFSTDAEHPPGFVPGRTFSTVVSAGGKQDPDAGWGSGPTAAPAIAGVVEGSERFSVRVAPPPEPAAGYRIAGHQAVVDGVVLPTIYAVPRAGTPAQRTITVTRMMNANVYDVRVAALYERTRDGQRRLSDRSNVLFAHPKSGGGPDVVPGSLARNTDADGNTNVGESHPGGTVWNYRGTGSPVSWRLVRYRTETIPDSWPVPRLRGQKVFARNVEYFDSPATPEGSAQQAVFTSQIPDLEHFNVLVYGFSQRGYADGSSELAVGAGDIGYADSVGEYYRPPVAGSPPRQAALPAKAGRANTATSPVRLAYDTSSNDYYLGDDALYGHRPADAFDGRPASYFLSVGNASPGRGFAFEWVQGRADGQTLKAVRFSTVKTGYTAYVSVLAYGRWVQFSPHHLIPYNPHLPESHNGGNIPYAASTSVATEDVIEVEFPTPIPGATKVRLTLRNLQDFNLGTYQYRGGIRELAAVAVGATQAKSAGTAGEIDDDATDTTVKTVTKVVPPTINTGIGAHPGKYADYSDIVKLICAWAGFFWPANNATIKGCDGAPDTYDFGPGPFGLPKAIDPVLGADAGRVWGDFEQTGTAGVADLTSDAFDKHALLDVIAQVREIVGFLFYIDEYGSVVWRMPNYFKVGNNVATLTQQPRRTGDIVLLDESTTLLDLTVTLKSRNVRERVFIGSTDGTKAALAQGWNPNPIGLRRVAGWLDQNLKSQAECQRMADFICLRQLFSYRTDTVTIPGYPRIQVDDQVRIYEKTTAESYLHYVTGIDSTNDGEDGAWTYTLSTQWLGEDPFGTWLFHSSDFSAETQAFLDALGLLPRRPPPSSTTTMGDDMAVYVRVDGNPQVYITNGLYKRPIVDETERVGLAAAGLVPAKVQLISQTLLDRIPTQSP